MRWAIALVLASSLLLAQTNPIVSVVRSVAVERVLLTLAQAYCKSKVAWEALEYSINNIGTSLESVKPQFDQLVALLQPGGALYNDMVQWSRSYVGNYTTFRNYVSSLLLQAKGLSASLRAGASVLGAQYPNSVRVQLLTNYANTIDDLVNKASAEVQAYRALETMQYLSQLVSITHPKMVDVYIASNSSDLLALARGGINITAIIPPPSKAWLSLAACATDFSNNTFILCVAQGTPSNYTNQQKYYLNFNDPFYTNVYSVGLGSPCPINYAQSHAFVVGVWNYYVRLYNYYINYTWPYENLLVSTKNVLVSILNSLATDLLQPITNALSSIGKTTLPGMLGACMRLINTQTTVQTLKNYDPRDPAQLYSFLSNAARSFSSVFNSALEAANCMKYYLPIYKKAEEAYLNALAQKFKRLSGGEDIETWAQQNGIVCTYTPPQTLTQSLSVIINTYKSLLDPNSPTSFLNTLNLTQPIGVLSPDQVPVGPVGSPCS